MRSTNLNNLLTGLDIFIGLKEVKINAEELSTSKLIMLTKHIDEFYEKALVQILNSKYILNSTHIYNACYFAYSSFLSRNTISKSKEIELLLYLAANRQISASINDFGLQYDEHDPQPLILCIVSPENNLDTIWNDIKNKINFDEQCFNLDEVTFEKLKIIKKYFNITEKELEVVIKTYISANYSNFDKEIFALTDLVREKMVLLYIERI